MNPGVGRWAVNYRAEQILAQRAGVVQREVAGETFLVPIRGQLVDLQELFVVNEAGRWVWDHLDGVRPLIDMARGVAAEFEVDEATALRDIGSFAQALLEAGLAEAPLAGEEA